MIKLVEKKCVACEGGVSPFTKEQIQEYISQLGKEWEVIDQIKIRKHYKFFDFKEVIGFVNEVAKIAEEQQHHPDMHVFYGKAVIELSTHAIEGLSENDFIMAAKIDQLIKE